MSIIRFALLRIPVDIDLIRDEVAALKEDDWNPHVNRYHYDGKWDVLSLRSPGGNNNTMAEAINQSEFFDTPLMDQCPAIRRLTNELKCEKLSVRLLSLYPGAVIKEHTDRELNFENGEARLHFPVFTNPDVEFFIDQVRVTMNEGQCWYINANLPHRLANHGSGTRIHLVIDCRVNEWLQNVFQYRFVTKDVLNDNEIILRNKETLIHTIRELRLQTNGTASTLADKLEQQLKNAESNK